MSPVTLIILSLVTAPGEWSSWSLARGSNPVCWDGGRSVAFLADEGEGLSLVTCRWDGSAAAAVLGARSRVSAPHLNAEDAGRPVRATADGRRAIVGSRLLVRLDGGGAAELPPLVGVAADTPLLDAAISGDGAVVALVTPDGQVLAARAPGGAFSRVAARSDAQRVALDTAGLRMVVSGEDWAQCVSVDDGAVLAEVASGVAALSGDGKRLAYVVGTSIHRLDVATGRETALSVADEARDGIAAIVAAERGRRFVVRAGTRLLAFGWVRAEVYDVASCDQGARFSLSPDGNAVAYESGGYVRIAVFGLEEPVEVAGVNVPRSPRGVAFEPTLESLSALAERAAAARGGRADSPTGTVATDPSTGRCVFRVGSPAFSFIVPAGWSAQAEVVGASAMAPGGGCRVTIRPLRPCSDSAESVVTKRTEEVGLRADVRSCLLSGVPGATVSGDLADGSSVRIIAARWADGAVLVEVRASGPIGPEALRLVESIVLEPWPEGPPSSP